MALKIDPKFFPARVGQADLAVRASAPNAARLVDDLLAIEPENSEALTLRASLQLQRNDVEGALKTLNDLSVLPIADAGVFNNLGKVHELRHDLLLAEASYRRALVFDDRSADAHAGLGRALLASGKLKKAGDEIDAALKIDPAHAGALAVRQQMTGIVGAAPTPFEIVKPARSRYDYPAGCVVIPFRVELERLFVTVRLNDKIEAQGLIDTGTDMTLLNTARIKLDGLRPAGAEDLMGDFVGRVSIQRVVLDTLKLGERVLRNQTIGRIEQGAGTKFERLDFVLGMDVLGAQRFTLDLESSQLVLWPTNTRLTSAPAGLERIPTALVRQGNQSQLRPCIVATINQTNTATFLIDTGADAPMFVGYKKPRELGFPVSEGGFNGVLHVNDGTTKYELPVFGTAFTLSVGKVNFNDLPGRVIDASTVVGPVARGSLAFLDVIGTPFLRTLVALHIDVPAKVVTLDRVQAKK